MRVAVRLFLFLIWILMLILPLIVVRIINDTLHQKLVLLGYRVVLIILRIKVTRTGGNCSHSSLYVSNHISYVDAIVFGAYLPVRFTPKKEVSTWPLINLIILLSRGIYIERRMVKSKKQVNMISNYLKKKQSVIVFSEGTTSNGKEVLLFKSTLFESVAYSGHTVCPVAIRYESDDIAWYGDMTFMPHLLKILSLKKINVSFDIADPINTEGLSRKEIRDKAYSVVNSGFQNL